jgi:hypothetical protein
LTYRYKKKWNEGLKLEDMEDHSKKNEKKINVRVLKIPYLKEIGTLSKEYSKWIDMEMKKTKNEMIVSTVGKQDPKRHLQTVT